MTDIANKLLAVRGGEPVGKGWAERLATRSKELKMAFNRTKDYQRKLQEDPEMIKAWFKLVENTKAKYGIHDDDVHNFNETGFQMVLVLPRKSLLVLRDAIDLNSSSQAIENG